METPHTIPLSVLLVEDDAAIRRLIVILLQRVGVETESAADGEVALACLRARDYDAILLDLMMPSTNGFEVIRHIQKVWPERLRRVIVVTAASEEALKQFDHLAVRKVVRKPFDVNALIAEVLACGGERRRPHSEH